MKNRYEAFKSLEWETWRYRFTWRGVFGDKIYPKIHIFRFFQETGCQEELRGIRTSNAFYKKTHKLADRYIKWVEGKELHTECEIEDLKNFFIGAIGEFFFSYLLSEVKSVECVEQSVAHRYDFNYVTPLLIGEEDFGIDLTGVVSDKDGDRNCALQVKFWNPYAGIKMSMSVAQKALAEGVVNDFINPKEKRNVVICWLGDEDDEITSYLRANEKLNEHIIFIGKKTLNLTINNRNGIFWDGIVDKLTEFSTINK